MAKKLSSKANYLSKWNIKSITTKNGKKTTTRDLPEFINENKTTRYKR